MSKNLRGLSGRKGSKVKLFEEIVRASLNPRDKKDIILKGLSEEYLIGKSTVFGTSTFYDFLKSGHNTKKVFICNGTACLMSGKQSDLKKSLLESFSEDEIGTVTCLGHCHSNNAFMYDHSTYSAEDLNSVSEIIKSGRKVKPSFYTGTNTSIPALVDNINDIEEYYKIIRNYAGNSSGALYQLELSGLRGRGGAGFPFHLKLKTALKTVSVQKYVVCNADEGDPGAFSDKWLLEERPHNVLSGIMMTGLIIGADTGIIYIRGEYPESVRAINDAILQFEKHNLSEIVINEKKFRFEFQVITGAGSYICGEETSLLNSLEGLRPEVRTRPPFPAVYGLFGKPTVLSNVETFANISYILKEGGLAYAAMGTEKSPGTKLVSLDGAFKRPGIYEVRMGTPLRVVFDEMGSGTKYPVKAFQIGGPLGGIVPSDRIKDLTLDFESFSDAGFLLGHAGVVSIPADFPMINYLLHLFEFTSRESCGKCFPCRIGADRGSELIRRAANREEKIDNDLFTDLIETMELGSLCALGGGLPLPVKNAIQFFSSELEEYFTFKNQ
jgi:NADH:ubiquinone oxidoreductase subunit F (NADH-binding)